MTRTQAVVVALALALGGCAGERPTPRSAERASAVAATTATTAPAPPETQPSTFTPASQPTPAASPELSPETFNATITPVDPAQLPYSWRPGCPVEPADLKHVTVTHWGFDGTVKTGELVIHAEQAQKVVAVLRRLFEMRYPIEKMELIDAYRGDDDLSVAANNTSAFNCRPVTGGQGWSQHSYGWAIDINPVQNPYISGGRVSPPSAEPYRDRSTRRPGMITAGDGVIQAFASIGWEWGGYWSEPKDYQHFSLTGR